MQKLFGPIRTFIATCALLLGGAGVAAADTGVTVTGRTMSFNDATEVPVGMFGVHATPLSEQRVREWGVEAVRVIHHNPSGRPMIPGEARQAPPGINMIVECFFDRYQPALMLTDRDRWRQRLEELARSYGENARDTGHTHHVEFWNEPFLNWATRPGVNYDHRWYEIDEAEEGKPMRIRGQDEPVEHLVWSRQVRTVEAASGNLSPQAYLAHSYIGHRREAGDEFEFRGRRYRNEQMWWGRDPTQNHYWSGKQNRAYYHRMLEVFAPALKEANPDVQLVVGWDFHIQSHGWEAWRVLYKPLIDQFIDYIDGITEHHYGGDTRMVAGAYETVYAYAKGTHGKALKFYNTEAGGMLDPQQPGNPRTRAAGDPVTAARGGMTYTLRDILHLLDMSPDKAVARAAHEAHAWGGGGDEFAFRMLRPLRGRLIQASSANPGVWVVASLNADNQLAVVIFNDTTVVHRTPVRIDAPQGMTITGGTRLDVTSEADRLKMTEQPIDASGEGWSSVIRPPAKGAVTLVFDLEGEPPADAQVHLTQHVSGQTHNHLRPGEQVELEIDIPAERLEAATDAKLRLVYGWSAGRARIELNGEPIERQTTHSWVNQQSIPVELLRERNRLVVRCPEGEGGAFYLNAASLIIVEQR